jgi:serine/threonine-protein kinase
VTTTLAPSTLAAIPPTTVAALPSPVIRATPRPSHAPVTLAAVPAPATVPVTLPPAVTPPAGAGTMQVVVKTWGEVTVDGRLVGTTPLDRLNLPAGTHVVTVRHPLYEPWEGRITVRAGQTERLVVDFPSVGRRRQ